MLPARTWRAWLEIWELDDRDTTVVDDQRLAEFWSPRDADRALAWDIYVELMTRVTVQHLKDSEGNSRSALESIYKLFPLLREGMKTHGVESANTATLIAAFLNTRVRWFTAKWHPLSEQLDESSGEGDPIKCEEFRSELRDRIQPTLRQLAKALSIVADARL